MERRGEVVFLLDSRESCAFLRYSPQCAENILPLWIDVNHQFTDSMGVRITKRVVKEHILATLEESEPNNLSHAQIAHLTLEGPQYRNRDEVLQSNAHVCGHIIYSLTIPLH